VKPSRVTAVQPLRAIEGGRITILGADFPVDQPQLPEVHIGGRRARISYASPTRIDAVIPGGGDEPVSGRLPIRIGDTHSDTAAVEVGRAIATGLHQVDNPVFDRAGNLYVTYSGTRGQQVPVSIFRVSPGGTRETFSSGIVNPTSMAVAPDGRLYASSRFEGTVYRLKDDGEAEAFATDLGVACGLAFAPDGTLFVGDRSGTIFKVDPSGQAAAFATLPGSVAAFHLARGPDAALYVTGPTLSPRDVVYRIDHHGTVTTYAEGFGRPQGLAFDRHGVLHVIEALAGVSGLYRLAQGGEPELVVAGPGLVGVAFEPESGAVVVCSADTAYRFQS
jgi:sugar lactone lactonase YvrE